MLSIKKLTSVPVPNGLGKYLPETLYFVKQNNAVSIYLTDLTGDDLYQVSTGSSGGGGTAITTYFIAVNAVIPGNLNTGDVVIETTTGNSSGRVVRLWMMQSNGSVVQVSGSRRVTDGVVDNTIGNSTLANVTGGRYIVPSAGLSGDFVGHANQIAVYNGTTFFFVDADEGATYFISSGANAGQYWTWTGVSWTQDVSYIDAGVSHWTESRAWKAGDLVVKDGWTYVANGNVPLSTAFALGLVGPTWKALVEPVFVSGRYGESVLLASVKLLSSTPVVVLTAALPGKGVWKLDSFIRASNDQGDIFANGVSYALYDGNGTLIPDSEVKALHGSTPEGYQVTSSGRSVLTTTQPATVTLKAWRTGNGGNPWVLSDNQGRSKLTFEKIADE